MQTWANILPGSWLVLTGLIRLGGVSFPKCSHFTGSGVILAVLGAAAGVVVLVARR